MQHRLTLLEVNKIALKKQKLLEHLKTGSIKYVLCIKISNPVHSYSSTFSIYSLSTFWICKKKITIIEIILIFLETRVCTAITTLVISHTKNNNNYM